jgi:hypothetical protein
MGRGGHVPRSEGGSGWIVTGKQCVGARGWGSGGEQVGDRDRFVALWAQPADVDPMAGLVAVRAPLPAEVALLALAADIDGGVAARPAGRRRGGGRGGRLGVAGSG